MNGWLPRVHQAGQILNSARQEGAAAQAHQAHRHITIGAGARYALLATAGVPKLAAEALTSWI